ncbi:diguanylate cyclase [uncultured Thiodictyon sp.]|uniref:diguanylate cyclase n=1 Tax=uncultured Thiodictyon sp. TaxID=1846217 RepID=UPI0025F5E268|nr:diguanylate cyclase [uncultured Thiodictyon sp.]
MRIDIPTMVLLNVAASATLACSLGWVARRQDRDGLQLWTGALILYTMALVLLALRTKIPDFVSIMVANVVLAGSQSLFLAAIAQLLERRIAPSLLWGPPLILAGAYGLLMSDLPMRVIVSSVIFSAQLLMVMRVLGSRKHAVNGRGKHLVFFGLTIMIASHVVRLIGAALGAEDATDLMQETPLRTLLFLSTFVTLIVVSLGFILMVKERADERTRLMAMQDPLTGTWNRIRLDEAAQTEMARFVRHGHPVSVIMVDLDHFKGINDKFGHASGDRILRGFSRIAQDCIRANDVLGRWGGEEFVLLLPDSTLPDAVALAERIRSALAGHAFGGGIKVTASFGVATCQASDTWESWLHRADLALYRAKAAGRNRVETECQGPQGDDPGGHFVALIWSPAYESGSAQLDDQHRALFDHSNQLLSAILDNRSKPEIMALIRVLVDSIKHHFMDEEAIMRVLGYAQAEPHCVLHQRLMARAEQFADRFAQEQLGVGEIFQYLAHELVAQHILIEDRKYFPLLAA